MPRSVIRKVAYHQPMLPGVVAKLAGNDSSTGNGVPLAQSLFKKPVGVERMSKPLPRKSVTNSGPINLAGCYSKSSGNLFRIHGTSGIPLGGIWSDRKESAARRSNPGIKCIDDPNEIRKLRDHARLTGKTIALVPTMGALHDGHLKLIRKAAFNNPEVYVSIYVNPTQFGVNEDLQSYPKPWEEDLKKLNYLNELLMREIDYKGRITTVFRPSTEVMYPTLPPTSEPDGHGSFVTITPLANALEGASRPVFFRGVATVVMKLLNIVQPDEVYFGQKDIQQLLVVRRMMKDFHINTTLRVVQTSRDPNDGLALSSRNVYLGDRRRAVAPVLFNALKAGYKAMLVEGDRTRQDILGPAIEVAVEAQRAQRKLLPSQRVRFEIDYLSLADPDTLEELQVVEKYKSGILSGAMVMLPLEDPQPGEKTGVGGGKFPVRLIDNCIHMLTRLFPDEASKRSKQK